MILVIAVGTIIINSISLGQGEFVNLAFQHFAIESIGVLFLVYFWSILLNEFREKKTIQLLWSKQKRPLLFLMEAFGGIYTIYAGFILLTMSAIALWTQTWLPMWYAINLLISWIIVLSIVLCFSCITNAYWAMIITLILYIISYSINFIIFSTPLHFEHNISFQLFSLIQYIFPRLDLLYSTLWTWARWRALLGNGLYAIIITTVMIRLFLSHFRAT